MKVRHTNYIRLLLLGSCFFLAWGCSSNHLGDEVSMASSGEDSINAEMSLPFTLPSNPAAVDEDPNAPAPAILYSLDRIEHLQKAPSLLDYHSLMSNRQCEGGECKTEVQNMKYMQCSRQNDYLEKELTSLANGKSGVISNLMNNRYEDETTGRKKKYFSPKAQIFKSVIKPACMRMSLEAKFGASSKSFRECSAYGEMSRAFRPCISENYFKLISKSFDAVSTCLKDYVSPGETEETKQQDIRAAYAMINIESGFHMNAMSGTGAGGIGQLTQAAIIDANKSEIPKIREVLEGSQNPICSKMSHEFLDSQAPMRPGKKNSCDRVSIHRGNPAMNMIYTYAYLKMSKSAMNKSILNDKNYRAKFNLSAYDMKKVQRALMVWSHNTGPAGTTVPTKTLLNTVYRKKKVTNADAFINELQQYMKKFPASANKSPGRRTETSRYFPAITNLLNQIETSVGGGSCVN